MLKIPTLLIPPKKQKIYHFESILGRWWSKNGEIDFIAFNDANRDAIFCEVKSKHLTQCEAEQIVSELKEKAGNWLSISLKRGKLLISASPNMLLKGRIQRI